MCLRREPLYSVQWRYSSSVYTRACILPAASWSSLVLLQVASYVIPGLAFPTSQDGYTSLVNRMSLPSGETVTPSAPVGTFVMASAPLPSGFMDQTCEPLLRSETKKMRLESGDHRGRVLTVPSFVN